jgi:hypothetical protein
MAHPSNMSYTESFENLIKAESEKAECMSILHTNCYVYYNTLSCCINIPVIVLSTCIGFLQPLSLFTHSEVVLGAASIAVAIMKTLDNYFNWTKRSEAHRLMSLNYWKISKFIRIQLQMEERFRLKATDILSLITNDMENLKDSEPIIPRRIIAVFMNTLPINKTSLPSICIGLEPIVVNRPQQGGSASSDDTPAPVSIAVQEEKDGASLEAPVAAPKKRPVSSSSKRSSKRPPLRFIGLHKF